MERTNFVRGSIGIERCREVCRLLIHWGAELLGMPEVDEPESVCWWDDPLDISRASTATRDRSQTRIEHHWSDADLVARKLAVARESRLLYGDKPAGLEGAALEKGATKAMKESKPSETCARRSAGFHIAEFLKMSGMVWGGKADKRRLDLPSSKTALRVPLIHTRSETPTFMEYK